ncbi:hypothetical protein [Blastococcus tunisiensis]|uniref:Uncharacterized protein n=1 Tax=Blastococcus tunisiensis TaxID=1798228 RepID=A0A1I2JBK8_9ACTN|nr:hypothetical protein [Blastococcus sp. DSM 46838]SFF51213.1 hypothetical protein SAMN05216574_115107 [Blastococcus sp. DSM 46838]
MTTRHLPSIAPPTPRPGAGAEAGTGSGRRPPVTLPPQPTAVDRWLTAAIVPSSVLALVVVAGFPTATGSVGTAVRGLVLLAFWLVAPGAAVLIRLRMAPMTKLAQVPLVGLAVLVGLSTAGAWAGVWEPGLATAAVAVASMASAGVSMSRGTAPPVAPHLARPRRSTVLLGLGLLVSVGLWAGSIPAIRDAEPSVFGLLVSGPPTFAAALLGVWIVLLIALRLRRVGMSALAAAALLLLLRATASVAAPVPIAAWTYKHIGVVGTLQQSREVLGGTDIYMNWPAMFAGAGWFSDSSGVAVIDLARWITPLVHVLIALQAAALARALGSSATGATAAAALVVAFNWVGQDYFSPQALAMCLAAGILVLLVQSRTSPAGAVLALGLFAVVTATHQLTPFWLVALAVALTVLGRAPWWLAPAMALVLAAYVLSRMEAVAAYGLISGFDPIGNAGNSLPPVTAPGSELGSLVARGTAFLMWGSTLLVLLARIPGHGLRGLWRSERIVVAGALAFSPFVLLAAQSYGGEASLRVILYSSVGCAAVLGPALAGLLQARLLWATVGVAWALVAAALTAQSSFGLWSVNLMREEDVATAGWLAEETPDAVVISPLANWPGRASVDYLDFYDQDAPLDVLLVGVNPDTDPQITLQVRPLTDLRLENLVDLLPDEPTFIVFTAAQRAWDAYYATFQPGGYQNLLDDLAENPDWRVVEHTGDLWVYEYLPRRNG